MKLKSSFPSTIWIIFFTLVLVNSLLAFGPFSPVDKVWLGLGGLALVSFLSHGLPFPASNRKLPFYREELFPALPVGLWIFLAGVCLFYRFYKVTSLSTWPFSDEALYAFISFHIRQHWDWHFFYCHSQIPFLFFWFFALVLKFFGLSLKTLWVFPSLFSILCVPLGYMAARKFFSKSLSFFILVLLCVSFWALLAGRLGMIQMGMPFCGIPIHLPFGKIINEH